MDLLHVSHLDAPGSDISRLLQIISGKELLADCFRSESDWTWFCISTAVIRGVLGLLTRPMYSILGSLFLWECLTSSNDLFLTPSLDICGFTLSHERSLGISFPSQFTASKLLLLNEQSGENKLNWSCPCCAHSICSNCCGVKVRFIS